MTSETVDPGRPPKGGGAGRESFAPETGAKTRRVTVKMDGADDLERLVWATGTDDPYLRDRMINDVLGCLSLADGAGPEDAGIAARAALAALEALGPADAAEGMLAAQMAGCHAAAMECLRRAARNEGPEAARDANLRHATRLMALYERQLAALDRRQEARREREWSAHHGLHRDPPRKRPTASAARPVYRDEGGTTKDTEDTEDTEAVKTAKTIGIPQNGTPLNGKPINGPGLKNGLLSGTHLSGSAPGGGPPTG